MKLENGKTNKEKYSEIIYVIILIISLITLLVLSYIHESADYVYPVSSKNGDGIEIENNNGPKKEIKRNESKKNNLPKNKKERAEQRKILDQIRREKIIDKTLESLRGNLAFYVPDKMKWDETYKVYVGVSKDNAEEIITQIIKKGQYPYRENKIEIREVETDTIPLWIEMYAELLDPTIKNSFRISPTGKLYEKIDVGGLNVDIWEWDVTPISFDTSYLQLNIFRATQKDNYELVFKSTEKVIIQSTIWDRMFEFLKNNWQYIIGTICVPFIIWIVKRFTDRSKKGHSTGHFYFAQMLPRK